MFKRSVARDATAGPEQCILLFDPADLEIHEHLQAQGRPSVRHLERLEAALTAWKDEKRAPNAETLAYSAGVPARICEVLLSDLEEAGSVERDKDGSIAIVVPPEAFKTGVRDLVAKLKIFRYEGERRLRLIADYANSEECRSVFIRRYFGEDYPPRCGTCDRCRADGVVIEQASPAPISRPKSGPRTQEPPVACQKGATATPTCPRHEPAAIAGRLQHDYFNGADTANLPPPPGHEMLTPTTPDAFPFDNSYARLPERLFARLPPTPVAAPRLIRLNEALARRLRLDPEMLKSAEGVAVLAGNRVPQSGEPLAMAYAGHQFGAFVPQLGDGRAILLGEVVDVDGVRRDIQLKGSGPTPFSRNGDGRAALGPVLREYIVSEAMAALGIPTTRSLAAVTTGETVRRELPLPGAVLTRVASSHIRVGTFQYFAARADVDAIRHLADHVIARHYPEAVDAANPYRAVLEQIIARQADLIAQWLLVGFIHGVMNTDNMSIAGETIDYGPCAFMDSYDPATVFSSIDSFGRYAYGNQPRIGRWNLGRLAEAVLPLLDEDKDTAIQQANEALDGFGPRFEAVLHRGPQTQARAASRATRGSIPGAGSSGAHGAERR